MANAYLNMAMTTNVTELVRHSKALLRLPSNSSGASFLGSTDDDAASEFAFCINSALQEFMADFPILNVVTETLTTTAGNSRTAVPETLANAEILGVKWDYDGRRGEEIALLDPESVLALPSAMKDGDTTCDPPDYVYLEWPQNGGTGNFVWLPPPSLARDFIVSYRANSVVVTAANVQGTGDAVIVPVPDAMIECFAYCVACRLAERNTGQSSAEPSVLQMKYQAHVNAWTDRLASTPQQTLTATAGFTGMPGEINGNRFNDIRRPRFFR